MPSQIDLGFFPLAPKLLPAVSASHSQQPPLVLYLTYEKIPARLKNRSWSNSPESAMADRSTRRRHISTVHHVDVGPSQCLPPPFPPSPMQRRFVAENEEKGPPP